MINIAISGFNNDLNIIKYFIENNYNINETVDKVKFLVVKDEMTFLECKSPKIKIAMMNNIPIISYKELLNKL